MLGDCWYVSSNIKAFNKISTFPAFLGVMVALAFYVLSSCVYTPKSNIAYSIYCQHNVSQCKDWVIIAAELQGKRGIGTQVKLCLVLAWFYSDHGGWLPMVRCVCVMPAGVLCLQPHPFQGIEVYRTPGTPVHMHSSAVWKCKLIPKTQWCTQWHQGWGDAPALMPIPLLPWLMMEWAFLYLTISSNERL